MRRHGVGSGLFCGWELTHQGIDLAGGNRHDEPLDGADFLVGDVLALIPLELYRNSLRHWRSKSMALRSD